MLERIRQIIKKEFIQILRDPRVRMVVIGAPILQLLIFGYAAVLDVKEIPTAVFDMDRTPESRELIARFNSSNYFFVRHEVQSYREISYLLNREKISAALVLPLHFSRDLKKGRTAPVQVILDGSNSTIASVALSYSGNILKAYTLELLREKSGGASPGMIRLEPRIFYNPALENRFFYIPGIIGLIGLIVGIIFTAMSIVREKEQGTLEQIIVTPIRPIELMIGKVVPYAVSIFVAVGIQIMVAVFWFKVPLIGNVFLLFLLVGLFLLALMGTGIYVSTISQTQQQALLSGFFFVMPAMLLSGFMFPIENMPLPIQYLTYLNPLRYFMSSARGIFLKGVGLSVLWPDFLALAVMGAVIFTMSALSFRKNMG